MWRYCTIPVPFASGVHQVTTSVYVPRQVNRISPACSRVSPACSRVSPACNRVSPACSRVSLVCSRVSPACNRVSPACSRVSPACCRVSPACSRVSPVWDRVSRESLARLAHACVKLRVGGTVCYLDDFQNTWKGSSFWSLYGKQIVLPTRQNYKPSTLYESPHTYS